MNRKITICLLFSLSCLISVYSQSRPMIAIFPFEAVGVAEVESITASDLFETALVQTDAFMVIEQDQIVKVLEAQALTLSSCTDETCAVEIGKLLSAEQIALGSFSRLGSGYVINAKIIDVTLGRNIKADKVSFSSIEELPDSMDLLASKLAGFSFVPAVRIRELKDELSALKLEYEMVKTKVARRSIIRNIFGGLALASIGGTGISWKLGSDAYENYSSAVYTDDAARYRDDAEMYNVIRISSGALSLGFSVLSLVFWPRDDSRDELGQKIASVSAQIAELEAGR